MTRAVSAAQKLRNIDGKCRTAAPHTRNQGLIANLSNRLCPAQHGL